VLLTKSDYREHQGTYDFGADLGGRSRRISSFSTAGSIQPLARSYDIADPSFANYVLGTQVLKTFTPNYTGKINWNINSSIPWKARHSVIRRPRTINIGAPAALTRFRWGIQPTT